MIRLPCRRVCRRSNLGSSSALLAENDAATFVNPPSLENSNLEENSERRPLPNNEQAMGAQSLANDPCSTTLSSSADPCKVSYYSAGSNMENGRYAPKPWTKQDLQGDTN